MFPLFVLIMNSCGNAIIMASLNSNVGEVEAGGTTNRLQTFVVQYFFICCASIPLYSIFPIVPPVLAISYYTSIGLLAGLNAVAYLCHKNQIARNAESPDDIMRFPFGLHNSELFIKVVNFLADNASWPINALYLAGLVAAGFYGSSVMVIAAVSILSVNYLFQHGWFPSFLVKPYSFFCATLMVSGTFGIESRIGLGLTAVNVIYFIYDYVQTNIRGVQSASSQFPIATKEHQLSLEKGPEKTSHEKMRTVKYLMGQLKGQSTRLTYNHFQQSSVLTNRVLGNKPRLTRQELNAFIILFDELDFNRHDLRETIQNEMVCHDKFNQQTPQNLIKDLELIPDRQKGCNREDINIKSVDPIDIRIAYLKREMKYMVDKLSTGAGRNVALYGHARMVLEHLKNSDNQQEKEAILLSLALRTGSQCSGAYIDEFANLNHKYSISENQELTLSDRAVFAALEHRTRRFSDYYFESVPKLKDLFPTMFFLTTDLTDYHTFENFAKDHGPYFHLMNTSLSVYVRDLSNVFLEKFKFYLFKDASNTTHEKLLFSDYYNEASLVKEVLKPDGCFGSVLVDWCKAIHPELYETVFLNEYYCPKDTNDPDIQTLARLMLVDLNIVEYTKPVAHVLSKISHAGPARALNTLNQKTERVFDRGVSTPVIANGSSFFKPAPMESKEDSYSSEKISLSTNGYRSQSRCI